MGRHCTLDFKGVSASTAIVSGIMTLVIQANPSLGWREIQHLVVESSDRQGLHWDVYNHFLKNGAGRMYHPVLGFGLLNATKLVEIAPNMKPLSEQLLATSLSTSEWSAYTINGYNTHTAQTDITIRVTAIEHVLVRVDFRSRDESDTEFMLVSPSNTVSLLMERWQSRKTSATERANVVFSSVNFWDETSNGKWRLVMRQYGQFRQPGGDFAIQNFKLFVYGTGQIQHTSKETGSTEKDFTSPVSKETAPTSHKVIESTRGNKHSACKATVSPKVLIVICNMLLFLLLK